MDLDLEIYAKLREIEWFARCGIEPPDQFDFEAEYVATLADALSGVESVQWEDARTEAQGDLTGYLARNCSDLYGGHWNRLAKVSRHRIQTEIMPTVLQALGKLGAEQISDSVLLDLNRIALQWSYQKRCPGVPDFFTKLLQVYASGRLPCGWSGNLDEWPTGRFVVY